MVTASASNTDFRVGIDRFDDLVVRPAQGGGGDGSFHYFYDNRRHALVKRFLLGTSPQRNFYCEVTLIQKGDRFTPRLCFSTRTPDGKIVKEAAPSGEPSVKARVDLEPCHENIWKLLNWVQNFPKVEVLDEPFSLIKADDAAFIKALQDRNPDSKAAVVKALAGEVSFSQKEINQMLDRKGKLDEFKNALADHATDEGWWQNFFSENKWIFGYGLDYRILNIEQEQPHYGGTRIEGRGGQRGDYLTASLGDLSFTVLVEIKTPATALVEGQEEIRNGAWRLGRDLLDGLAQLQANCATWEIEGSRTDENRDRFDAQGIQTVKPKGILVAGTLDQVRETRSQYRTFQRFRAGLHGIEILTFDELHQRASFIVGQHETEN